MDNPFESPAILSFCPGILGLERGIKRVIGKLNVVAYVEIEAFIIANLVAGMEAGVLDPAPIWSDAKTFDARPFRGKIHGIIGGYPCTPFSLAGTRSGENHPGHIYPAISRAIEATGPVWCFFENVDDHLSLGFDKVYQDLHRMGYAVETGICTAEEVGAPHERERMFIFALENTYRQRLCESGVFMQQQGRTEIISGGEELAITTRELQHWCWDEGRRRYEYSNSGETMADFISSRLEGFGLRTGSAEQENNNTNGKNREQLNPAWVCQLMGTTLERIFFVPLVIQSWSKQQS